MPGARKAALQLPRSSRDLVSFPVQPSMAMGQGDALASRRGNPQFGKQRRASMGDMCDGSCSERCHRCVPSRGLSFWAGNVEGCSGMQRYVEGCSGMQKDAVGC